MSGSTDSDILSRIPGLEGDEAADGDTNTDAASRTQDDGTADSGDGGSQSSRETDGGADAANQPPVVRRHDGLVERKSETDPRHRDLVDPITGQIVARGGIERRVFETAQRTNRENQRLKQQLEQSETRGRTLGESNTLGTQLGLSPEHQTVAMRVMADFIRDPVRTVEYMIAEVRAKGHQIGGLEGQGGQLDTAAIQRMLDEKLRPFTEQVQQRQQAAQNEQRARMELDSFLQEEPDARANLDVIGAMLQEDRSLNLPRAYTRMIKWCMTEQLDPNQPLGPQIAARQNQSPQTGQPPRQPRPIPGARTSMNGAQPVDARRAFDENSEWSSIIDASMREAGYSR